MDPIMQRDPNPYGVYVSVDPAGRIYAVNSDAFLFGLTGWIKIDKGYGDKYHHAQGNYLPSPLMDERGILRYMIALVADWPEREAVRRFQHEGEEWAVYERTAEEMDADYSGRPAPEPTDEELLLEMAADHEYRICLMELGVNANDL